LLDSIIEDRLLFEASAQSEDPKLVEQLNLDKRASGPATFTTTPKAIR
jgi:hypothetical protein